MANEISQQKLDTSLYLGAVLILTGLCLWTVWALEFPPLQDYPQHLFLAHVNATYADPAFNWSRHYLASLKPGPYMLFYLVIVFLEKFMPVMAAGKVFLSLYLILIGGLAGTMLRCRVSNAPPWGTLLIFPLAFHQMYFMGFTNFLASLPILAFAVLDHQRLAAGQPSPYAFARQALLVTLLLLCHPFTVLVYMVLSLANALLPTPSPETRRAALAPPILTAIVFTAWYLAAQPNPKGRMPLLWWPVLENMRYYCLMFTGMRWTGGIRWGTFLTWTVAIGLVLWGAVRALRDKAPFPNRTGLSFGLTAAGFLALPFWAGQYSYFNLRMAPISYLFAALLAGFSRLPRRPGLALAILAAVLIDQSASMQRAFSNETAEIKPIIAAMSANARILPMTFQTDSKVIDRHFFPEAHSHDHFYYHLIKGGGASPSLFPSPMLPVQLRQDADLPLATHGFSWLEQGSKYDYILTRGAPVEFIPFITRYAKQTAASGEWLLFTNEHNR